MVFLELDVALGFEEEAKRSQNSEGVAENPQYWCSGGMSKLQGSSQASTAVKQHEWVLQST